MSENDSKNLYKFTWIIRNYSFGDEKFLDVREIRSPPFTAEHFGREKWYLSIRAASAGKKDGVFVYLNKYLAHRAEKTQIQWHLDFYEETNDLRNVWERESQLIDENEIRWKWNKTLKNFRYSYDSVPYITVVCYISNGTPVENPSFGESSAETIMTHFLKSYSALFGLQYEVSFKFKNESVYIVIDVSDNNKSGFYFNYGNLCLTYEVCEFPCLHPRSNDYRWYTPRDSCKRIEIEAFSKSIPFQNFKLWKDVSIKGLFVFSTLGVKDYQTANKNRDDIVDELKLNSSEVLKHDLHHKDRGDIVDEHKLDFYERLKDDLLHMYKNKIFTDATLKMDNQTFSVHKGLLASRSPVFHAMFDQDMTENQTGIVVVTDIDANTMDLFLQYLYTSKLGKLCVDSALNLLLAAEKYEVPSLKSECGSYLLSHLSDENVCEVLAVADMISHHQLKSSAMSYIKTHADKVLLSDSWKHLCTRNVLLVSELLNMMSKEYGKSLGGK